MDWALISIAGGGLLLAGIIKGATGLGYSSCALPFLVFAIGLKPAMALVLLPAMATNVAVALTAGHFSEIVRRFAPLYAAMVPGIALGLGILVWLSSASAAVSILGCTIVGYVAISFCRPHFILSSDAARLLKIPTGFANGVLTGLTGSQVMPLFPYMMALDLDPNRMVQAINLSVMIASIMLALGLLATNIMTTPLFVLSVLAIVPALLGVEAGRRVRAYIPATQFRTCVLVVLLLMGLLLIAR
jgi:uncharacterized membrane protein YfcA